MPDKEIDFQFTDDGGLQWRVVSYGDNGEPWLFRAILMDYDEIQWVSVRRCTEQDMLLFLKQSENSDV